MPSNPYEEIDSPEGLRKFKEWEEKQTKVQKSDFASMLEKKSDEYLEEVEEKNVRQEKQKKKFIKYILKKTDVHKKETLEKTHFDDVKSIYNRVKAENKPWYLKLFEFALNVENEQQSNRNW